MEWILGIDGGGTKTTGCAGDPTGKVYGQVESGASNYHVVGIGGFKTAIGEVIAKAESAFGLSRSKLRLLSLGLAGVDRPRDREIIAAALADLGLACRFIVNNDAKIALAAGNGAVRGIVLIAGTGSIAYGVNARGQSFRAGGWGHLISDEGSGYDIGRQGLLRGIKAWEGREGPSVLLEKIMDYLQVADMDELIGAVYNPAASKAFIASLAEVVTAAAREGDPLARGILADAAKELAGLVESVLERGFPGEASVPVCGYGSLLRNSELIRKDIIRHFAGRIRFLLPEEDPVAGALRIGVDCLKAGRQAETVSDNPRR